MISITIPTYEMNGSGKVFLEKSLEFISKQTFKLFEVVVSDHSISDEIEKICDKFNFLDIKYIKNQESRGSSSSNLNNAILNAKYNIIKFLMQDEFLYDENILYKISKIFEDDSVNWVASSCINGTDINNHLYIINPHYNNDIIKGNNTIGSPSCVTIRKTEDVILFDSDYIWLMDCDYYKRMYDRFGEPFYLNDSYVFITHHNDQLTNTIPNEIKRKEHEKILIKYKI